MREIYRSTRYLFVRKFKISFCETNCLIVNAVKIPLTFWVILIVAFNNSVPIDWRIEFAILCRIFRQPKRARHCYKAARLRSLVPSPGTTALSSSSLLTVLVFSKGQCETVAYRFLGKRGGYAWVVTQATLIHCSKQQKPISVVCVNYILR